MNRYRLAILFPAPHDHHVVHVFTIQTAETLAWMRSHIDALISRCVGAEAAQRYDALMLTQEG